MKTWCIKLSLLSMEGEGREEKVEGWACWKDVGELLSWDRQPSTRGHGEEDDRGSKASVEEWADGGSKETPHTSGCGHTLGRAQHGQLSRAGASNRAYEMARAGQGPDPDFGPESHQGGSSAPRDFLP